MSHNSDGEPLAHVQPLSLELRAPEVVWTPVANRGGIPFSYLGRPKLVIHTTETLGLPQYPYPPHLTINLTKPEKIWQHVTLDKGAYALKSAPQSPNYEAGTVYQVEHISYAKNTPTQPDLWYFSLAREIVWFHRNKNVPLVFAKPFVGGEGYGEWGGRMSASEFANFSGICGHQHVNGNDHWDPGALDMDRLWGFINELMAEGDELAHLSDDAQKYFQEIYESLKTDPDKPNKGDSNPPGAKLFSFLASFHRWAVKKTGKEATEYDAIVARFMDKT